MPKKEKKKKHEYLSMQKWEWQTNCESNSSIHISNTLKNWSLQFEPANHWQVTNLAYHDQSLQLRPIRGSDGE